MRENLFNGIVNSGLTVASIVVIAYALTQFLSWALVPTWNANSLSECREILTAIGAVGDHGTSGGACWGGIIKERWPQLLFGFYPNGGAEEGTVDQRWRPILAFVLLFVAVIPVLFNMISRRMNWVLLLATLASALPRAGGAW